MSERRLITISVPVYNEADNVEAFHERIAAFAERMAPRYDFELLFTDNHSEDDTFVRLTEIAARDPRVRVVRFSRNFGFQKSILHNYLAARGEAAVQIDVDLQDPPELIEQFLELWEQGFKVVYGVRRRRDQESVTLQLGRKVFYRLINMLSDDSLPVDAGDFRLIDRAVLEALRGYQDQQPYLRGMIAAMGFRQMGVPYDRAPRLRGKSKFNLPRLVGLALDGILHHSIVPLRLATFLGAVVFVVAVALAIYFVVARLVFGAALPAGWTSVMVVSLFSLSANAMLLGILGEYIGRIFVNVKRAPLTIVEQVIDQSPSGPRP